jgi:hypothetical protein
MEGMINYLLWHFKFKFFVDAFAAHIKCHNIYSEGSCPAFKWWEERETAN